MSDAQARRLAAMLTERQKAQLLQLLVILEEERSRAEARK